MKKLTSRGSSSSRFGTGPACTHTVVCLFVGLGASMVACSDRPVERGGGSAELVIRDSAGVEILHAEVPGDGPADGWRIEPEPFVTIGLADGEEPYLFSSVQMAGRLTDGRIYVVDDGPHRQIRTFDGDGRFVEAWGGPGDGPGEFALGIRMMVPYRGDSLAVIEYLGRRIHVFDSGGQFGRRITPQYGWQRSTDGIPAESCCRPELGLPDGSWVVEYPEEGPLEGSGPRRGEVRLVRLSPEGDVLGDLGGVPGRLWHEAPTGSPSPVLSLPLTGRVTLAVRGEHILVGNGTEYRVDEIDVNGGLVRSIRVSRDPPRFDGDQRQAYEDRLRAQAGSSSSPEGAVSMQARVVRFLLDQLPDQLPAYSRILVDPDDRIWLVSAVVPSLRPLAYRALVLSPAGHVLGEVEFPLGVWPMAVGRDEVFAGRSDELGVQQVVAHRIVR